MEQDAWIWTGSNSLKFDSIFLQLHNILINFYHTFQFLFLTDVEFISDCLKVNSLSDGVYSSMKSTNPIRNSCSKAVNLD